ncbi:MAG: 4-hydroxy-tetrahydrodipicolinate reductase [Spirochaetaceae bacterium]|jgi:4-hydroxy-tetrahydrodipicolinate reductase|nr:4-hydroxy-tetrahydrodipicolinate reductase [Spirochaetaceae bacterium]
MKVIISGYGKMGRIIAQMALERGHKINAIVEPNDGVPGAFKSIAALPADSVDSAVIIDFSHPLAAVENITQAAERKIPVVVGTTGWYDRLDEVKTIIKKHESAMLYAANFSLGVNIFYKISEYAAALFDKFTEYDVGGVEFHHNKKADSPSGTAKAISERVIASMTRKKTAVYEKLDRPPEAEELHFASVRVGNVPGTHSLYFDSPADSIEITHTARSREALASGALAAAQWLDSRSAAGNRGVFTMEDVLKC